MKKLQVAIIFASIISCILCGSAYAAMNTFDVGAFDGINIGDNFNVSVMSGSIQSIEVEIPDGLEKAVTCEVEGGILKLVYDKGKLLKDAKPGQISKQRFNVIITVPSFMNFLKICGKSSISVQEGAVAGDDVSIIATDQAEVSSLPVSKTAKVSLILNKKAKAVVDVSASSLMVQTDNGASLSLKMKVTDCTIEAGGSSAVVVNGEASTSSFISEGSSHLIVNGRTGNTTSFRCRGMSETNASNAVSQNISVTMSGGCFLSVSASERLSIDSLDGGSKLEYYGLPVISIRQINASSVIHVEQK